MGISYAFLWSNVTILIVFNSARVILRAPLPSIPPYFGAANRALLSCEMSVRKSGSFTHLWEFIYASKIRPDWLCAEHLFAIGTVCHWTSRQCAIEREKEPAVAHEKNAAILCNFDRKPKVNRFWTPLLWTLEAVRKHECESVNFRAEQMLFFFRTRQCSVEFNFRNAIICEFGEQQIAGIEMKMKTHYFFDRRKRYLARNAKKLDIFSIAATSPCCLLLGIAFIEREIKRKPDSLSNCGHKDDPKILGFCHWVLPLIEFDGYES